MIRLPLRMFVFFSAVVCIALACATIGCSSKKDRIVELNSRIKIDLPESAVLPRAFETSVHFSLDGMHVGLYVADAKVVPALVARARKLGVAELEGITFVESKVAFGAVTGERYRYTPSGVTHYGLEVPNGYVSISTFKTSDSALEQLEAVLSSLRLDPE